jgi:hypothetical protein
MAFRRKVGEQLPKAGDASDARARVFISYSRRDLENAEHLRDHLIAAGFDAFLDKHDISPGEPWRERLSALISSAEKIVFLISPSSIASDICAWEVDHAERLGKSLLPVVIQETRDQAIPGRLSRLNYVFMREADDQAAAKADLVSALSTDLQWEREKTRIGDKAEAWKADGRAKRRLLTRRDELEHAERWRDSHPQNAPPPTETQLAFIAASRKLVSRRQRAIMLVSIAAVVIAAGLTAAALWQRHLAVQQEQIAKQQRDEALINRSRGLARASREALASGRPSLALGLARRALPKMPEFPLGRSSQSEPYVRDAKDALYNALVRRQEVAVLRGHANSVTGAFELSDGRILTWSPDGNALIWPRHGNKPQIVLNNGTWLEGALELAQKQVLTWMQPMLPECGVHRMANSCTSSKNTQI